MLIPCRIILIFYLVCVFELINKFYAELKKKKERKVRAGPKKVKCDPFYWA